MLIKRAFLILSAVFALNSQAAELVTYIELDGRYVELTGAWIPCRGFDGWMAVEANDIGRGTPIPDNSYLSVYCWLRHDDQITLFRPQGKIVFPASSIKMQMIDRDTSVTESSSRPAPS